MGQEKRGHYADRRGADRRAMEGALPCRGTPSNEEITATSLASIAASLEYQNLMSLPD